MNRREKGTLMIINIIYIMVLFVVILPLLWVSFYNRPTADDWSYSADIYQALQQGTGSYIVIPKAFEIMSRNYIEWEGRFSNSFLASLQPGIWGESCYWIVGFVMLGSLIIGEMVLIQFLIGRKRQGNGYLWLPVIVPPLIMQILYSPSTVESFFWYTGAVNYTFIYALSMIFFVIFLSLSGEAIKGIKRAEGVMLSLVMAVLIGGDNFSTSLSVMVSMLIYYLWLYIVRKKEELPDVKHAIMRTGYLVLAMGVSLVACILAPGNRVRLDENFHGSPSNGALWAIGQSLFRTAQNIYSWTNLKVVLMLLLTLPFIWMALKNIKYNFSFPLLFSLLSFGIYATQITATMYVDGTTGGNRAAAILYYYYHINQLINLFYWTGWVQRRIGKRIEKTEKQIKKYLLVYCGIVGVAMVGLVLTGNLRDLSSYRAYRDCRQGWAQQYATEWDVRYEILHDDNIKDVEFMPLSVYPESIMYTDLQYEDGYYWVNIACANYYSKNSVNLIK